MMLCTSRTIIFWQKAAFDVQYFAANPISSTSEQVWRIGFGVGGLCGREIGAKSGFYMGNNIAQLVQCYLFAKWSLWC